MKEIIKCATYSRRVFNKINKENIQENRSQN